ncbi:MAG: class I SAM-dependent methyltransferase [Leptolyngbyaceae cyanobacterium MO_188.B28]|nr:class I SAM-dependent methyltransferase [Leptolyngbyaceae cyanobacterium MO_188.B28]
MVTNFDKKTQTLRPIYDFPLPALTEDLGARGNIYRKIKSGSQVLDVGCDTGRFGEALTLEKGCIVDGIEPYQPAAEIAQNRLHQIFTQAIEDEHSFKQLKDYDVVLFLCVLEHLVDPWSILKGAQSALRMGGSIYIIVPNIAHISIVRRLLKGKFEYSQYGAMDCTHLRWFTRSSLRKSLEDAGFSNVEVDVIPQVPYLSSRLFLLRSFKNLLTKVFPDQLGGSIIGCGHKLN